MSSSDTRLIYSDPKSGYYADRFLNLDTSLSGDLASFMEADPFTFRTAMLGSSHLAVVWQGENLVASPQNQDLVYAVIDLTTQSISSLSVLERPNAQGQVSLSSAGDRALVTFHSVPASGFHSDEWGFFLSKDGSITAPQMLMDGWSGADWEPNIARFSNGDFVLSFISERNGGYDVFAQRLSAQGARVGEPFKISGDASGRQMTQVEDLLATVPNTSKFLSVWHNPDSSPSVQMGLVDASTRTTTDIETVTTSSGAYAKALVLNDLNKGRVVYLRGGEAYSKTVGVSGDQFGLGPEQSLRHSGIKGNFVDAAATLLPNKNIGISLVSVDNNVQTVSYVEVSYEPSQIWSSAIVDTVAIPRPSNTFLLDTDIVTTPEGVVISYKTPDTIHLATVTQGVGPNQVFLKPAGAPDDAEKIFAYARPTEVDGLFRVDNVIVISPETLGDGSGWGDGTGIWVQTSYSGAYRGSYAGIGYYYSPQEDLFFMPPWPAENDAIALDTTLLRDSMLSFNGNLYELVKAPVSFDEALELSQRRSYDGVKGHLLTVTSEEEQAFIHQNFVSPNRGNEQANIWLGATDRQTEGAWVWVTGPETGQPLSYTKWLGQEPNNGAGVEDLAVLHWNNGWFDVPEHFNGGQWFVVEYEGAAYTLNTLRTMTAAQVGQIPVSVLPALDPDVLGGLNTSNIKGLTAAQMDVMTVAQVAALRPEVVGVLNDAQLRALSFEQVEGLTCKQTEALTARQVATLTGEWGADLPLSWFFEGGALFNSTTTQVLTFTGGDNSNGGVIQVDGISISIPVGGGRWQNAGVENAEIASRVAQALAGQPKYAEAIIQTSENGVIIVFPPGSPALGPLSFDNAANPRMGMSVDRPGGVRDGINYGENPYEAFVSAPSLPMTQVFTFTNGEYANGATVNFGGVSVVLPTANGANASQWNADIASRVAAALDASPAYANAVVSSKANAVIVVFPGGTAPGEPLPFDNNGTRITMSVNAPSGIVDGVNYGQNPFAAFVSPDCDYDPLLGSEFIDFSSGSMASTFVEGLRFSTGSDKHVWAYSTGTHRAAVSPLLLADPTTAAGAVTPTGTSASPSQYRFTELPKLLEEGESLWVNGKDGLYLVHIVDARSTNHGDTVNGLAYSAWKLADTPEVPVPSFEVSSSKDTLNEGESLRFTINTSGLSTSEPVIVSLQGISAADFSSATLGTGEVVNLNDLQAIPINLTNRGQATLNLTLAADGATEGLEFITLIAGDQAATVKVSDTSFGAANDIATQRLRPLGSDFLLFDEDREANLIPSLGLSVGSNQEIWVYGSANEGIRLAKLPPGAAGSLVALENLDPRTLTFQADAMLVQEGERVLIEHSSREGPTLYVFEVNEAQSRVHGDATDGVGYSAWIIQEPEVRFTSGAELLAEFMQDTNLAGEDGPAFGERVVPQVQAWMAELWPEIQVPLSSRSVEVSTSSGSGTQLFWEARAADPFALSGSDQLSLEMSDSFGTTGSYSGKGSWTESDSWNYQENEQHQYEWSQAGAAGAPPEMEFNVRLKWGETVEGSSGSDFGRRFNETSATQYQDAQGLALSYQSEVTAEERMQAGSLVVSNVTSSYRRLQFDAPQQAVSLSLNLDIHSNELSQTETLTFGKTRLVVDGIQVDAAGFQRVFASDDLTPIDLTAVQELSGVVRSQLQPLVLSADNTLTGSQGDDLLKASFGNDLMICKGGVDTLDLSGFNWRVDARGSSSYTVSGNEKQFQILHQTAMTDSRLGQDPMAVGGQQQVITVREVEQVLIDGQTLSVAEFLSPNRYVVSEVLVNVTEAGLYGLVSGDYVIDEGGMTIGSTMTEAGLFLSNGRRAWLPNPKENFLGVFEIYQGHEILGYTGGSKQVVKPVTVNLVINEADTYWSYFYDLQDGAITDWRQWDAPQLVVGQGLKGDDRLEIIGQGTRFGLNNNLSDVLGDSVNAAGVAFGKGVGTGFVETSRLNLPNGTFINTDQPNVAWGAAMIGNPELGWRPLFVANESNGLGQAPQSVVSRSNLSLNELFGQDLETGTPLFITYNDQDDSNPGSYNK